MAGTMTRAVSAGTGLTPSSVLGEDVLQDRGEGEGVPGTPVIRIWVMPGAVKAKQGSTED